MEDKTPKILEILNLLLNHSKDKKDSGSAYRIEAYTNAIEAIKENFVALNKPITSNQDANFLYYKHLIGQKIRNKLYDIIKDGDLEEAKKIRENAKVPKSAIPETPISQVPQGLLDILKAPIESYMEKIKTQEEAKKVQLLKVIENLEDIAKTLRNIL
jgi:hypothetical protein